MGLARVRSALEESFLLRSKRTKEKDKDGLDPTTIEVPEVEAEVEVNLTRKNNKRKSVSKASEESNAEGNLTESKKNSRKKEEVNLTPVTEGW